MRLIVNDVVHSENILGMKSSRKGLEESLVIEVRTLAPITSRYFAVFKTGQNAAVDIIKTMIVSSVCCEDALRRDVGACEMNWRNLPVNSRSIPTQSALRTA